MHKSLPADACQSAPTPLPAVPISQMNATMTCDTLVELTPPSEADRHCFG